MPCQQHEGLSKSCNSFRERVEVSSRLCLAHPCAILAPFCKNIKIPAMLDNIVVKLVGGNYCWFTSVVLVVIVATKKNSRRSQKVSHRVGTREFPKRNTAIVCAAVPEQT